MVFTADTAAAIAKSASEACEQAARYLFSICTTSKALQPQLSTDPSTPNALVSSSPSHTALPSLPYEGLHTPPLPLSMVDERYLPVGLAAKSSCTPMQQSLAIVVWTGGFTWHRPCHCQVWTLSSKLK